MLYMLMGATLGAVQGYYLIDMPLVGGVASRHFVGTGGWQLATQREAYAFQGFLWGGFLGYMYDIN